MAEERPLHELIRPDWMNEADWQATLERIASPQRIKADAREHVERYLASRGEDGYRQELAPLPCLLITTIGHRSGKQALTALNFLLLDGKYYVVGSLAGIGTDPVWARNLKANPQAWVQVKNHRWAADVHLLSAAERQAIWPTLVRTMPLWEVFQQRTDRPFPVFALAPKAG